MEQKKRNVFVIIDAYSLIHRAYYAVPRLSNKEGEVLNAVYGFTRMLIAVLKEFQPSHFVAAFDEIEPTFRKEMFEEYKATRKESPDDLYAQVPRIREVLGVFCIPILSKPGFEGDDVIGTLATMLEPSQSVDEILIVSGDLDTLQLVSEKTKVYTTKRKFHETVVYGTEEVHERYGFAPEFMVDYKGLRGDPSDNIPGVEGVGEKTAQQLIQKFGTIENLYASIEKGEDIGVTARFVRLLTEQKEEALFSKKLATICTTVPLEFSLQDAQWGGFSLNDVKRLFRDLGFDRLLSSLDGGAETSLFQEEVAQEAPSLSRSDVLMQDLNEVYDSGVLSQKVYEIEKDIIPIIEGMENEGILVDVKQLNMLQKRVEDRLSDTEQEVYKIAGKEFNINSPKQLSEVLFDDLAISTKGIRKTSTKQISTAAGQLEKIVDAHPIIAKILEQRELHKILSTYIVPLFSFVRDDGRIHTTFHPLGTSTGRMSSSDPNLQSIPIRGEFAEDLRSAFVASPNKMFLACDYSQMELRVVAHMAEDKNMIQAFQEKSDIHKTTAAFVFGVPVEDVSADMRYRAKALNFGIIYGIGARSFAASAQISIDEARDFIDRYLAVFDGVAQYMERVKDSARSYGFVETLLGRKRLLPDIHSPNPQLRAFAERVAINMPVQGSAADIVKMAMIATAKKFPNINLLLQLHDELLWEGDADIIQKVAPDVVYELEHIFEISVPLQVEYGIGSSWSALK